MYKNGILGDSQQENRIMTGWKVYFFTTAVLGIQNALHGKAEANSLNSLLLSYYTHIHSILEVKVLKYEEGITISITFIQLKGKTTEAFQDQSWNLL